MNWRVWGEKHRTIPSAQPIKIKSSPTVKQFAFVVWKIRTLNDEMLSLSEVKLFFVVYNIVNEKINSFFESLPLIQPIYLTVFDYWIHKGVLILLWHKLSPPFLLVHKQHHKSSYFSARPGWQNDQSKELVPKIKKN